MKQRLSINQAKSIPTRESVYAVDARRTIHIPKHSEIGALTSMRGLAALLVMFFHLRYAFAKVEPFNFKIFDIPFLAKGYLWVDFFFILSGFIMTYRYDSEFTLSMKFFKDFIFMRWLRIYPLHFLTLFAFLGKSLIENGWTEIETFKTTIYMNLFLVQSWGYYLGKTWNYPSWSLSEEWGAYLLFPFLLSAFYQFRSSKWIQLCLALNCFGLLASFAHFVHAGSMDMTEDYGLIRCLFEFSIGISLFYLRNLLKDKLNSGFCDIASFVTSALIFACLQTDAGDIYVVGLSAFSVFFLSLSEGRFTRFLNLPVLKFIGQISFSLYIWHAFFGKVFESLYASIGTPSVSLLTGAGLYLGLSLFIVAFSSLSYEFIELRLTKFLKNKLLKESSYRTEQKVQGAFS